MFVDQLLQQGFLFFRMVHELHNAFLVLRGQFDAGQGHAAGNLFYNGIIH